MKKLIATTTVVFLALVARGQTSEQLVAAVLMGEARGEGLRGMQAVAEVIGKRASDKGLTPLEVVSHKSKRGVGWFSCVNGSSPAKLLARFSADDNFGTALAVSRQLHRDPAGLPGVSNGATHFTHFREQPFWARGVKPCAKVGAHVFFKIPNY